jgi:isoquinoline 1-oxidoreductase alpha subunit
MIALTINGKKVEVDGEPADALPWTLHDRLRLTGTKFGCGVAQCGACTVHVDGAPTRSA